MEFIPIRINTLRPNSKLFFDIYVPIGNRHVHYMRKNDEVDISRLKNLKSKKVRKVFIIADEETLYLDYLDQGLSGLVDSDASIEEKASAVHDSLTTSAENAERSLDTEEGFQRMGAQFGKISDFLSSDKGAMKKILESAGNSVDNFQHAATVSSLSLALGKIVNLSEKDMLELGTAALLHDIRKNKFDFDPQTPKDKLSPAQLKKYKAHSADGADILGGKPFVNPRILALIANHEELGNGKGFPNKLDLFKLEMPFQILNLCNDFDRFCTDKKVEHRLGLDDFFEEREEFFDNELINHLVVILN